MRAGAKAFAASAISREAVPAIAAAGAVLVEDVQNVADEAALFHLLNLVREQRPADSFDQPTRSLAIFELRFPISARG